MKIPKSLRIHNCNKCKGELRDTDFKRCGFNFVKHQYFFDYLCRFCDHNGCYVLQVNASLTAGQALGKLAESLIEGDAAETQQEESDSKGNIRETLNKIVGVQDLLKLGGKDVPREQSTDDDPTDLP